MTISDVEFDISHLRHLNEKISTLVRTPVYNLAFHNTHQNDRGGRKIVAWCFTLTCLRLVKLCHSVSVAWSSRAAVMVSLHLASNFRPFDQKTDDALDCLQQRKQMLGPSFLAFPLWCDHFPTQLSSSLFSKCTGTLHELHSSSASVLKDVNSSTHRSCLVWGSQTLPQHHQHQHC